MQSVSQKSSKRLIQSFEAKALKKRSPSVKFADDLTTFFGTFTFLAINILIFASWIAINLGLIPGVPVFDPFPFVLMTTAVSLEAIILSCIVLMSQSRSSFISSMREEMQLQVNLYTEREITKILKLMDMLVKAHKIKVEDDPELREMLRDLDHSYIEKKLTQQLTPKKENPLDLVTSIASMPVKELEKVVEGIEERRPFKGK
jgi:uncharacterized membrane protein